MEIHSSAKLVKKMLRSQSKSEY